MSLGSACLLIPCNKLCGCEWVVWVGVVNGGVCGVSLVCVGVVRVARVCKNVCVV